MSQKEIEDLRDAAYIPNDRVMTFVKILNTREQEIEDLLSKPRRPGFDQDMHDFIDQFASIADEFNDNLDEYQSKHRDIRKSLPKLVSADRALVHDPARAGRRSGLQRRAKDGARFPEGHARHRRHDGDRAGSLLQGAPRRSEDWRRNALTRAWLRVPAIDATSVAQRSLHPRVNLSQRVPSCSAPCISQH